MFANQDIGTVILQFHFIYFYIFGSILYILEDFT
jgi:hypothetical protein